MKISHRFFFLFFLFTFTSCLFAQNKRVACIGDSVTKGYGLKDSTESYPYLLQKLLKGNYLVRNFGFSGATLLKNGHNPYVNTKEYHEALAFCPDILIVSLGLNDTDPRNWPNYQNEFISDYSYLLDSFRKINPKVEIYVCKMTPIFSGHRRFLSGTRDWFSQVQNLIPLVSQANEAVCIDNYTPLASRIDLFEDFLHPSSKGAEIIAKNIYQYLVPVEYPLTVNKSFGDHMVLQREVNNLIAGRANAGERIQLFFDKKQFSSHTDSLGKWTISLPKMRAGGPYTITIKGVRDSLILDDILFGDVFLASGQSNMAFPLRDMNGAKAYFQDVVQQQKQQIRIFKNHNLIATTPIVWNQEVLSQVNDLDFFSGKWEVPSSTNIQDFSAIAYVFAQELASSIDVPIGIVDLSVGGANTESWIPRHAMEQDNLLASYIHSWRQSDFVQDFCKTRASKNLELAVAKNQRHPYDPSYNFEAGVSTWLDTQFKAVLWYQGESNAHNIEHHSYLFRTLIDSWRTSFNQNLPFYFVQLSSINRPSWGAFRNSQRLLSKEIPKVYMAVSSDLGDYSDVHPKDKRQIAQRLANLVKQHEYDFNIQARSPNPIRASKRDGIITVEFDNCKELKLSNDHPIRDLMVMDERGNFIPIVNIQFTKNKIYFKDPTAASRQIFYAFSAYTNGNLISDSGVPVSTFNLKLD